MDEADKRKNEKTTEKTDSMIEEAEDNKEGHQTGSTGSMIERFTPLQTMFMQIVKKELATLKTVGLASEVWTSGTQERILTKSKAEVEGIVNKLLDDTQEELSKAFMIQWTTRQLVVWMRDQVREGLAKRLEKDLATTRKSGDLVKTNMFWTVKGVKFTADPMQEDPMQEELNKALTG